MTCAAVVRRLEEHLASIEAQVGEARRIVASGPPYDSLLASIGAIQVAVEQLAAAAPYLCSDTCQMRFTSDEFCAEFMRTFKLRIRGYEVLENRPDL